MVREKIIKKHSKSSARWLKRQFNDPYVSQAKIDNYRSRAAYKLLEIQEKFRLIKPGNKVVDLGAAPGSWSQVASSLTASSVKTPKVIAIDLLTIEPIAGVITLQGDCRELSLPVLAEYLKSSILCPTLFKKDVHRDIAEEKDTVDIYGVDVVLSDMAANSIGHQASDHLRSIALCEQALEMADYLLKVDGHLVVKLFHGSEEKEFVKKLQKLFQLVKYFKPKCSRAESNEIYLVGLRKL